MAVTGVASGTRTDRWTDGSRARQKSPRVPAHQGVGDAPPFPGARASSFRRYPERPAQCCCVKKRAPRAAHPRALTSVGNAMNPWPPCFTGNTPVTRRLCAGASIHLLDNEMKDFGIKRINHLRI